MFTFKVFKITLMSTNTKLLLGFIVGAAAGAAVGILLTSDKGKELLERLKETASELEDEFKDVIDKGKKMAEDLGEKVRDFSKPA
jgi:gas vesicle protein